jgi:hypothetical protein
LKEGRTEGRTDGRTDGRIQKEGIEGGTACFPTVDVDNPDNHGRSCGQRLRKPIVSDLNDGFVEWVFRVVQKVLLYGDLATAGHR